MFYVFNMCYPKGCNNFYAFLEVALLKFSVQVSSSVVNFITRLDVLKLTAMIMCAMRYLGVQSEGVCSTPQWHVAHTNYGVLCTPLEECCAHSLTRCAEHTSQGVLNDTAVAHLIWCVMHTFVLRCAEDKPQPKYEI